MSGAFPVNLATNQLSQIDQAKNYSDLQGLDNLKRLAREDERAALRPVAEQFEALFLQQILKESRKVSFDEGFVDGKDADFFKDWHDKQLSQDLSSKGSLGLADKIVDQLAPDLSSTAQSLDQAKRLLAARAQSKEVAPEENIPASITTNTALSGRPVLDVEK